MRKKYFSYITLILSLFLVSKGFMEMLQYSEFYDKKPAIIIEDCEKNFQMLWFSTMVESNEKLQTSCLFFCGSNSIGFVVVNNEEVINITSKQQSGDIKVVFRDTLKGTVISKEILEKQQNFSLEPGEYQIFLIGKFFSGRVSLESMNDTISFSKVKN